jgi:hypothetical protein
MAAAMCKHAEMPKAGDGGLRVVCIKNEERTICAAQRYCKERQRCVMCDNPRKVCKFYK